MKLEPVDLPEKVTMRTLQRDVAEILLPSKRITVVDAAEKSLVISTGGANGKFDSSITPYMKEPMNMSRARDKKLVVFAGSARSGKTLSLLEGTMTHTIMTNPGDMLFLFANNEIARRFARLRIDRALKNSPDLLSKLSPTGHSDNILSKYMRNGMAILISHPSPAALSANDFKICIYSDHDRRPDDDNAEGSIVSQAMMRNTTFGSNGITIVESSPGRDFEDIDWLKSSEHEAPPVQGIMGWYNQGDRRIYYWQCPHCHDAIMMYPGMELFNLPSERILLEEIEKHGTLETANKYAHIWCPHCGSRIEEKHKFKMNMEGEWRPETDKENTVASYWQSGVIARFSTWSNLIEKELKALQHLDITGDDGKLRATRNVDQGIPYVPASMRADFTARELEKRSYDLGKRVVPEGVRYIIMSVDVQIRSFVCQAIGHGVNDEKWVIDRFNITKSDRVLDSDNKGNFLPISPAGYDVDWHVLTDHCLLKSYELSDGSGRRMTVHKTVCDSAGKDGVTENAYKYWKHLRTIGQSHKFELVKGMRRNFDTVTPFVDRRVMDKTSSAAREAKVTSQVHIWLLHTNALKDAVMGNLKKNETGSNYYHFPDWLGLWWYEEILSEKRTDKGWESIGKKRNETLDLLCYDKAATMILMHTHGSDYIDWENKVPAWADTWEHNTNVDNVNIEMANDKKPRTKKRRGMTMQKPY